MRPTDSITNDPQNPGRANLIQSGRLTGHHMTLSVGQRSDLTVVPSSAIRTDSNGDLSAWWWPEHSWATAILPRVDVQVLAGPIPRLPAGWILGFVLPATKP